MVLMPNVYLIHNIVNDKIYIGKTKQTITRRWSKHQYDALHGSPLYFHNAIRKYGAKAFKVINLSKNISEIEALQLEKQFIAQTKSNQKSIGYNSSEGADGCKGFTISEETRKKLSESHKGQKAWNKGIPASPEQKIILLNTNLGKKQSVETKAKRSASLKIAWATGKHKGCLGQKHSEVTKQKMSLSHKGYVKSAEHRLNLSLAAIKDWKKRKERQGL